MTYVKVERCIVLYALYGSLIVTLRFAVTVFTKSIICEVRAAAPLRCEQIAQPEVLP